MVWYGYEQDIPYLSRVYHHISLIPDRVNLSSVYLPTTVGSYISLQWQRSRRAEEQTEVVLACSQTLFALPTRKI